ncbi:MAG TPA: hypothetical protein VF518_09995 [Polyangia bacterium]
MGLTGHCFHWAGSRRVSAVGVDEMAGVGVNVALGTGLVVGVFVGFTVMAAVAVGAYGDTP